MQRSKKLARATIENEEKGSTHEVDRALSPRARASPWQAGPSMQHGSMVTRQHTGRAGPGMQHVGLDSTLNGNNGSAALERLRLRAGCQAALDEKCRSLCDNVSARAVGGRELSWMCIPGDEAVDIERALAMYEDDLDHASPRTTTPPRGFCKGRGLVRQQKADPLNPRTTQQSKALHEILQKPICPQSSEGWHPFLRSWTNARSRRLAWVHIVKAGASFGTTLVHYANSSLPEHRDVKGPHGCEPCIQYFFSHYRMGNWFRDGTLWQPWRSVLDHGTVATSQWPTHSGHGGVGDHWPITPTGLMQAGGHLVGLFREPFARARSSYLFFCKQLFSKRCGVLSFQNYSRQLVGSVTKMLSGQAHGLECHTPAKDGKPDPSNRSQKTRESAYDRCRQDVQPDLPTALSRLDAFAFVGLTEDYARSVCLFHAMFPSRCLAVEFKNIHPSAYHWASMAWTTANVSLSAFIHDPYDSELWLAACERYKADLTRYEVTGEKCRQLCPKAPKGAFLKASTPIRCQLPTLPQH